MAKVPVATMSACAEGSSSKKSSSSSATAELTVATSLVPVMVITKLAVLVSPSLSVSV